MSALQPCIAASLMHCDAGQSAAGQNASLLCRFAIHRHSLQEGCPLRNCSK